LHTGGIRPAQGDVGHYTTGVVSEAIWYNDRTRVRRRL